MSWYFVRHVLTEAYNHCVLQPLYYRTLRGYLAESPEHFFPFQTYAAEMVSDSVPCSLWSWLTMMQVVMLDSLHRMGAMHHDIKPDNILVSSDGHLVLADFSIGRLVDGDHKSFVGWQPWYGAPECMGIDYDVKPGHAADVWSMGVCILEM